jgi:REP element-mobilizing transposase RayT
MPQSLASILVHCVFSTKLRAPYLRDIDVRHELHAYVTRTLQSLDCPPSAVDGVEDHIRFLCLLSRKIKVMDMVEEVKTASSKWIKTKGPSYRSFCWQAGYGAFSVSESMRTRVIRYIRSQEEHHRTMTFQDEFRQLCEKHRVQIDERYAWD